MQQSRKSVRSYRFARKFGGEQVAESMKRAQNLREEVNRAAER